MDANELEAMGQEHERRAKLQLNAQRALDALLIVYELDNQLSDSERDAISKVRWTCADIVDRNVPDS